MDVEIEKVPVPLWRKYWYVIPIAALIMAAVMANRFFGDASYVVERREIQLAEVETGDFVVEVRATGVLKPLFTQRVSAQVSGRVDNMAVKPGASVDAGQVIVTLLNPELRRQLEKARWELKATVAEQHAQTLTMQSQLVDLETMVLEAEMNYQSTKLKLDAETELLEKSIRATLSKLDYERTKLDVQHQLKRWEGQKVRYAQLITNIEASAQAREARLGLLQNEVEGLEAQVASLSVTADRAGIVQQMPVELGQQMQIGDTIATIADQTSLMAQLQVQELQVRDIALGQQVMIDTRGSSIDGEVVRIDPAVVAGMVQVDVSLSGDLPIEARPDLNVDGLIEIANIKDALHVRRPAYAQRFSDAPIYRLSANESFVRKAVVQLGQSSVNRIQVLSGLKDGDQIVVSDTSDWNEHAEIYIN
ncbi:MAG: efflux RND transporter periplasmic adaptor subunit [Gammaproteobacteria bacterium]